ncbi:MAG: hypothetical protein U5P41_10870 [Gammaproteobacteria bacterium]|nr:hypothetical protein [Gammaproteobacteria bacterium]
MPVTQKGWEVLFSHLIKWLFNLHDEEFMKKADASLESIGRLARLTLTEIEK